MTNEAHEFAPDAPLLKPLGELEALGLARPPYMSIPRFIEILVQAGILSADPAEAYLKIYRDTRFSGKTVTDDQVDDVCAQIAQQIAGLSAEDNVVKNVAKRFFQPNLPPVATQPQSALSKAEMEPAESVVEADLLPGTNQPKAAYKALGKVPKQPARRFSSLTWVFFAALALIWSAGAIYLGYRLEPKITRTRQFIETRMFGLPRSEGLTAAESLLERLRDRAVKNPEMLDHWWKLGLYSARQNRFNDALLAYQHILAREPKNPEVLNNVAWILCTATDPLVKDPIQAAPFAEKAYALSKAPHIIDTLAEITFQNGDPSRAVTLTQEALKRLDKPTEKDRRYYQDQLKKFRKTLERQAPVNKVFEPSPDTR
jgi:cytochrome c-type biogenesis protein CcmH/NrfG